MKLEIILKDCDDFFKILNDIQTKEIITSCPLCVFNFRYVNYKTQMDKKCQYITDYLLESIEIQ